MSVEYSIKNNDKNFNACDLSSSMSDSSSNEPTPPDSSSNTTPPTLQATNSMPAMSAFALAERNSECLRIVRQLLDTLNEPNLILLRSFICVLWHIANNSEFNKMSANNLGVCVGQSLLNDEHQSTSSNKSSINSTFTKRHRRTRSQCILSSTLTLTNSSPLQNSGCYLNSNSAQVSIRIEIFRASSLTTSTSPSLTSLSIELMRIISSSAIKESSAPFIQCHNHERYSCSIKSNVILYLLPLPKLKYLLTSYFFLLIP